MYRIIRKKRDWAWLFTCFYRFLCLANSSTMKEGACSSGTAFSELHGVTTQNTVFFIGTAVRASNPTKWKYYSNNASQSFLCFRSHNRLHPPRRWWCYFTVSCSMLLSAIMNTCKFVKYQKSFICRCVYIGAKQWMKVSANMFFF
jgi:hypothetical protein